MLNSDELFLRSAIDEQNCTLKFASWTYDSARIDLTQKTNIGDLSNFMANSGRLTLPFTDRHIL